MNKYKASLLAEDGTVIKDDSYCYVLADNEDEALAKVNKVFHVTNPGFFKIEQVEDYNPRGEVTIR